MKRILLMFSLLLVCSLSYSQKIILDERDSFTGDHKIETNEVKTDGGVVFSLSKINSSCFINIELGTREIYSMLKDAETLLKLTDGTVITINNLKTTTGEYVSNFIGSLDMSYFALCTDYFLTDTNLKQLQNTAISKVRFYTTDGYIDRDVTDKQSKKLIKLFNLFK